MPGCVRFFQLDCLAVRPCWQLSVQCFSLLLRRHLRHLARSGRGCFSKVMIGEGRGDVPRTVPWLDERVLLVLVFDRTIERYSVVAPAPTDRVVLLRVVSGTQDSREGERIPLVLATAAAIRGRTREPIDILGKDF